MPDKISFVVAIDEQDVPCINCEFIYKFPLHTVYYSMDKPIKIKRLSMEWKCPECRTMQTHKFIVWGIEEGAPICV